MFNLKYTFKKLILNQKQTDLLQKTKEECHTKGYSKLDKSKRTDEDSCLKPKSVSPVEEAARERVESLNKRQRRPVEDIVTKVEGFIDNDVNVLDDEKNNKSLDKGFSKIYLLHNF